MKLKNTFLFIGLLSLISFSQVQGPPPCGYFVEYACDDNNDGFAEFNLAELFPFSTFCREDKGNPEDYYPIVFYETQVDMDSQTNPISNPNAYYNKSITQSVFYRANKIIPDAIEFLSAENLIEVKRLANSIPDYEQYGITQSESVDFDLTGVNVFCGVNLPTNYTVTYYVSQTDANSGINPIVRPSSYPISNSQDIYVRAEHNSTGYVETTSFVIRVLFAVAQSPGIPDIYKCDFDEDRQDGIYAVDLMDYNSIILGDQDPDNFTVSYYATQVDAESKMNSLPFVYAFSDQQAVYARVDENTKGSFSITSFVFSIFIPPLVSPLDTYEVCDEDGDEKSEFDLNIVMNQINSGEVIYDISFYTDINDEYGSAILNISNYTNITNPQTIYVDVEDMDGFGCYTILALELVVKDCSQAGVIELNTFYDANTNETIDTDEINFLNGTLTYEKNNDGIQHTSYSSTGVFNIISDDEANTYDITYSIDDEFQQCYNIATATYENINVVNGSKVNYNLPITKIQDCGDIAVYLVSYISPRPGFNYKNYLVVQNKGVETVASGSVEFVHDVSIVFDDVSYVDSGNSVTNTSTGFILNFNDLEANYSEIVQVNMGVPVTVNLGGLLTSTVIYSTDDLDISNNTSTLTETVIGSYDPNDILESHGPEILHSSFDSEDYLYYTIRFQNVGTADATNVSIDNTLNPKLDKSTIQMLSSSHSNVFTRTNDQLNWQFDNIHLPNEDIDEPASHGYVYYKIKPLAGYSVGDIIPNTAEIYFDFNDPVITNTFETEFTTTLSNGKFNNVEFLIFPNPATHSVLLNFNKSINDDVEIVVYDIQGKLILNSKKKLKNKAIQLNVSALKSGIYFLKVNNGNTGLTQKLIIE